MKKFLFCIGFSFLTCIPIIYFLVFYRIKRMNSIQKDLISQSIIKKVEKLDEFNFEIENDIILPSEPNFDKELQIKSASDSIEKATKLHSNNEHKLDNKLEKTSIVSEKITVKKILQPTKSEQKNPVHFVSKNRKLISWIPGTLGAKGVFPKVSCKGKGTIIFSYTVNRIGNVVSVGKISGSKNICLYNQGVLLIKKYVKAEKANSSSSGRYKICF